MLLLCKNRAWFLKLRSQEQPFSGVTELAVGFLSLVEQLDVFDSMQGFLAWICIDATVVQGISDRLGEHAPHRTLNLCAPILCQKC